MKLLSISYSRSVIKNIKRIIWIKLSITMWVATHIVIDNEYSYYHFKSFIKKNIWISLTTDIYILLFQIIHKENIWISVVNACNCWQRIFILSFQIIHKENIWISVVNACNCWQRIFILSFQIIQKKIYEYPLSMVATVDNEYSYYHFKSFIRKYMNIRCQWLQLLTMNFILSFQIIHKEKHMNIIVNTCNCWQWIFILSFQIIHKEKNMNIFVNGCNCWQLIFIYYYFKSFIKKIYEYPLSMVATVDNEYSYYHFKLFIKKYMNIRCQWLQLLTMNIHIIISNHS